MKKIKVLFLLCTWVVLAFAGACGDNTDDTPTQGQIDSLFELAAQLFAMATGEICNTDCADLEFLLKLSEGTTDCDGGGTITTEVGTCNANGNIQVTVSFNNCDNGQGNLINGTATGSITASPTLESISISSTGLTANDFTFSSNNATVAIPCVNGVTGNATCSGSVTAGSATCILDTDCSGCTL